MSKKNVILGAISLISAVLYIIFAYHLERSNFIELISLYTVLFSGTYFLIKNHPNKFWVIAGVGIIFRLLFLPVIPNLSQDFYRFIWDGRLLVQFINPYLVTPETYLNDPSYINTAVINQGKYLYQGMGNLNGSHFSNYPPINQLFFAITALIAGKSITGSVIVLRLILILSDIGILYFGKKILEKMKLPSYNIFWYFLNPIIIIEFTGNLHFEGAMLFFAIWSIYLIINKKVNWSAILWGVSISVKLLTLLLLPFFLKYFWKKSNSFIQNTKKISLFYGITLLTVLATFLPFLSPEFTSNYAQTISLWFQKFEFNASIYYVIRWIGFKTIGWNIIETVGKVLPVVFLAIFITLALYRKNKDLKDLFTGMMFGIFIYFLLSTTVHPWYIATPLLLSVFTKYKFLVLWSFLIMLTYSSYQGSGFYENLWFVFFEYTIVIGYCIYEVVRLRCKKTLSTTNQIV